MSLNSSPRRGRILVPANLDNLKGGMIVGNSVAVPSFLNDRQLEGAEDDEVAFNGTAPAGGDYHNRMNSPN
jgi:hypothetical protein